MIYPPDDLLNDLQAVVEPRHSTTSSSDGYSHLPQLPGTEKQKEMFEVPPGYDAPALSDDEDQVRTIIIIIITV